MKVLEFCKIPGKREEIQNFIKINNREYFRTEILNPLIEKGLLKRTIPDKPRSSKQKYIITEKGKKLLDEIEE